MRTWIWRAGDRHIKQNTGYKHNGKGIAGCSPFLMPEFVNILLKNCASYDILIIVL